MALTAQALMNGPRGRRLCLEVASVQALDQETDAADAFIVGVDDVVYGEGQATWSFGTRSVPPELGDVEATVDDVARALDALSLIVPTEQQLWDGLGRCVFGARYWQPPDGYDQLAASPQLRDGLGKVASLIVLAPQTSWWQTGCRLDDQWEITWLGDGVAKPNEPAADPAAVLYEWLRETVAEEKRAARWSSKRALATSGSWWVLPHYLPLSRTARRAGRAGPVGLDLVEDSGSWSAADVARVAVPEGVRVYEVDGPDSWAALCRRYPLDVSCSRRGDWHRTTGRDGAWVIPNFVDVATDYEGVHVSVAGYLTTAGLAVPVDEGVASTLAGWYPDETQWLIDVPAGKPARWVTSSGHWVPA